MDLGALRKSVDLATAVIHTLHFLDYTENNQRNLMYQILSQLMTQAAGQQMQSYLQVFFLYEQ